MIHSLHLLPINKLNDIYNFINLYSYDPNDTINNFFCLTPIDSTGPFSKSTKNEIDYEGGVDKKT